MSEVIIKAGQSIWDVGVEQQGNVDGVFDIADANDVSVSDALAAGDALDLIVDTNNLIVRRLSEKNIHPGTVGDAYSGGVGFWSVGVDFVVS